MDPNACLALIEECLAAASIARSNGDDSRLPSQTAREARENLHEWLAKGGFEPDWTTHIKAASFYTAKYSKY